MSADWVEVQQLLTEVEPEATVEQVKKKFEVTVPLTATTHLKMKSSNVLYQAGARWGATTCTVVGASFEFNTTFSFQFRSRRTSAPELVEALSAHGAQLRRALS